MAVPAAQLSRLLTLFPCRPAFAFAYGSQVKRQANHGSAGSRQQELVDLMLVVDDPLDFHTQNLAVNRSHYSFLRWAGPAFLSKWQQAVGARVYYNTLVPVTLPGSGERLLLKYGVIKTQHLINDLLDWDKLYVAGRLQKPVHLLSPPDSQPLTTALSLNLRSAIHAALLMHDESFTEEQLYRTIAGLSYGGDVRMGLAEDRHKVRNIVSTQVDQFRQLFHPILMHESMQKVITWNESSRSFVQDVSTTVTLHHLNLLPKHVQSRLYLRWNKQGSASDVEEVLQFIAKSYAIADKVRDAVAAIVRSSSLTQTLAGIPMAGINKSITYAGRKVRKMLAGQQRGQQQKQQQGQQKHITSQEGK